MKVLIDPMVLAVDFDGVIADCERWVGQAIYGPPKKDCAKYLGRLYKEGWIIIIYTGRPFSANLSRYLRNNHIPFDAVNRDVKNWYDQLDHKIFANVFLDDKSLRELNKKWNWKTTYWRLRWKFRYLYKRRKKDDSWNRSGLEYFSSISG